MHGFVGKRRGVTTQSIRTLSLATALAMLIGLFNGAQAQASDYPAFSYTLDSNDNATVTGCVFSYECSGQSIEIPDSIDSHTVVAIGDFAFQEAGLTAVTIPNSVTSIGYKAFQTNQLSAVTLPSSLTTISEWAFNANSLSSITFPSTLTSLGQYSFNVNSLTSVSFLGNGVEDVAGMFTNNSGLTAVDVLYGSTGWGATFGNLPVRVGAAPFTYDVDADGNATVTGYTGTVPQDLVIPATLGGHSVVGIGAYAFLNSAFTSVTIPDSVTTIGFGAFQGSALTSVTIPDSVTSLGDAAFLANQLTSVTIPSSVTSIGYVAFAYNQLTSVTIPSSVTSIGDESFLNNHLTSITIPRSVTSIGHAAFSNNELTSVTFLGDAPSDGGSVFDNNSGLSSVDVAFGSTGWGATFSGVPVRVGDAPFTYTVNADGDATVTGYMGTVPADLVIPATLGDHPVIAIGDGAFYESQLTSVSLPSSLIAIGNYAFYHNGLTSLVIPDSVTNLGNSAFQNNSLTSVIISSGIVTISNSAFAGNALTQITIPATVEVIEAYAFYGNQLASVTIPDSVSNIRDYAFYGNLLTSVKFEGNAPIAGYLVFANNGSLQSLTRNYTASGWSYSWSGVPVDVVGAPTEQTITFGPISDQNLVDGSLNLDATASSVLDVSYSSDNEAVCSIADSLVTFLAAGTCSVTATQAGNGIYAAAAPVTQSFEILKSSQLIQFTAIPNQVITDNTLDLDASATSGLDVNFISNSLSICTVSSSTVTFVAAGVCSITVEQTGDDTYASANSITKEFTITKGSQSITFPSIENQEFTTTPFDIAPESSAALDVTITSNSSAVCTYDSELGALIFASAGTCNVTASQAGNDYYEAAPDVTVEFVISAIAPGSPLIVYKRVRARADIWFVPGSTGGSTSVSYEYTLNGGRTWLTMTSSMIKQSLKWPPHDPDATQYEYDFVPPSLTLGTSYSIAVRAINENGESQGSNVVTVKPTAPPRVPTVTGSKYKYRTLWLSLAAPANTGGSKILSYGFSVNHGKWKYISVNKIRTYAAVSFVRKGHTYSVRVRARNAAGPGWISAPRLYTIS